MRIHFCALCTVTRDSTINFATMLLNLGGKLPNCNIRVDFSQDAEASYATFVDSPGDDLFLCVPTYTDALTFIEDMVANYNSAWTTALVARHLIPDIEWRDDGPHVSYNIEATGGRYATVTNLGRVPLIYAIARYEGMPRNLREVFHSPVTVDMGSCANVYARHVFKGHVGLRSVLR